MCGLHTWPDEWVLAGCLQVEGWDKPGFDASGWSTSVPVRGPAGKLVSPKMPPARKIKVRQTDGPTQHHGQTQQPTAHTHTDFCPSRSMMQP